MVNKLHTFLDKIFKELDIYFYTIDYLFKKIVIFSGSYILEVSSVDRGGYVKKSTSLYFYIRKFEDIKNIYTFIDSSNKEVVNQDISSLISIFIKYDDILSSLLSNESREFIKNTFTHILSKKKVLFILRGGGMEETIEKSFISYCSNSKIDVTVLYKFGTGYWGQTLNQDGFFNELKANNPSVKFDYREDFDDDYIDSIIDNDTEMYSFQYDYKGKHSDLNMIVLSSVTNAEIDCSKYKNIFSCYNSRSIGYSSDRFINIDKTDVYKIFNPQNISLLDNFRIVKKINNFILSGGMSWARDFSILNTLNGAYKGVLISDENHDIKNFLSMYRGIQSYYGFFGAFKISKFAVYCHLDEFNDDDRSKMIATSLSAGQPVILPYNDGLIVKEIIDNKLGLTYANSSEKDLLEKVRFFAESDDNIEEYGSRCREYSQAHMDINKFINLIFEKSLKIGKN